MRAPLALSLLSLAAPALAQTAAEDDAARVIQLNRAVQARNQAVVAQNAQIQARAAEADAAYRRERQAYEAALSENDRIRAAAAQAQQGYEAESRRHAEAMEAWRRQITAMQAPAKPAPTPAKPTPAAAPRGCEQAFSTGTHLNRKGCQPSASPGRTMRTIAPDDLVVLG